MVCEDIKEEIQDTMANLLLVGEENIDSQLMRLRFLIGVYFMEKELEDHLEEEQQWDEPSNLPYGKPIC